MKAKASDNVRTIDMMHELHGWMPGYICRTCEFYNSKANRCLKSGKRAGHTMIKNLPPWSKQHIACGFYRIEGESPFRASVRAAAKTLPMGEFPPGYVHPAPQKGLF